MANIYGYCRISTKKQSIDRQIRNIKAAYPTAVIVEETYTGTSMNREKWGKLISRVSAGDTIVFDSVSRMSRNAAEGFAAYKELFNRGINLVFIKEPHINTETFRQALDRRISQTISTDNAAADKLMNTIIEALREYTLDVAEGQITKAFEQSEKEVEDMRQRTREGIETARINGKAVGGEANRGRHLVIKKAEPAKEKILKYSVDFGGSLNDTETMTLCGISRNTLKKYKAELAASAS